MTQIDTVTRCQSLDVTGRKPRVRFAPSPTGLMHIGGYRTALFDWLYARKHGGAFILRIEDTDTSRSTDNAVDFLVEGMKWLGMDYDEGPYVEGPHAPYVQTQRKELYQKYAQQLIESGHAYKCYCTSERLAEMRQQLQAQKLPPRYDRRCRNLSTEERAQREADGERWTVRFAMPFDGETVVHDELRGDIIFKNANIDDYIILKSDGLPTYHLAHVVDDYDMEITHLLRAEEWIATSPLHMQIWEALGWPVPLLYHVPDVLGNDKRKLSKRHGAQSWKQLQELGFLPEAVINYLALVGWAYDDKTEFFTRQELVDAFTLERISVSGAIYDQEKLAWMNGMYIRQLSLDEFTQRTLPYLERVEVEGGLPDSIARPLDVEYTKQVLSLEQERLRMLSEAAPAVSFFYTEEWDYEASMLVQKQMDEAGAKKALQETHTVLSGLEQWEHSELEAQMRELTGTLGLKTGQLFGVVRIAVSGRKATPPLFQMMEVLGRERTLRRIERALAKLS